MNRSAKCGKLSDQPVPTKAALLLAVALGMAS